MPYLDSIMLKVAQIYIIFYFHAVYVYYVIPYALLLPETPPILSAPDPPDSEPAEPGASAGEVRRVLPSVAAVLPSSSDLNINEFCKVMVYRLLKTKTAVINFCVAGFSQTFK